MRKKKWPLILLVLGILALVGAGTGIYLWNKPPAKVENTKGIRVSATDLCKQFSTDETQANKTYLNKAIEVTGTVSELSKNQDGAMAVVLQGDDAAMGVQCTMREKNVVLEKGKVVTLKGFCSGNTMFDVLLTDCIVSE